MAGAHRDLTAKIHRLRQPVIAAVNGVAYGGGLGIAAACDIRVASGAAFDLVLTARAVDADEALRLGLASRVIDSVVDEAFACRKPLWIRGIRCRVDEAGAMGQPGCVQP